MATSTTPQSQSTSGDAVTGHGITTSTIPPSTSAQSQPESHVGSNNTSTSIEMSEIDTARQQQQLAGSGGAGKTADESQIPVPSTSLDTSSASKATTTPHQQHDVATEQSSTVAPLPTTSSQPLSTTESTDKPQISRFDSVAIGEATEDSPIVAPTTENGPTLTITLLLTTGARHPYKIDEKYLTKRNVTVPGLTEDGTKDPLSISVYSLKELILREWREEWEVAPSSPSSIRLIFFGRLLDDSAQLKGTLAVLTSCLVLVN